MLFKYQAHFNLDQLLIGSNMLFGYRCIVTVVADLISIVNKTCSAQLLRYYELDAYVSDLGRSVYNPNNLSSLLVAMFHSI